MVRALTTEEFIERAKNIHGDKFDYSLTKYKGVHINTIIICKKHGQFKQTPNNHIRTKECCPICCRVRLNTEKFITKAKKIHGDKYDYSLVEYKNNKAKVIIICKEHGKFEQSICHLRGSGCPACFRKSVTLGKEKFIEKAKKIHGNKYDYSLAEYIDTKTKLVIICKEHGEFLQTPSSHFKNGCFDCFKTKMSLGKEKFIENAKAKHGDRFDYNLVEYINYEIKVTIVCKEHGEFKIAPKNHLAGSGCRKCFFEIINKNKNLGTEEFIKRAKEVHGDKYNYDETIYTNSNKKVKIFCNNHKTYFYQQAGNHLSGNGCKKCNNKKFDYGKENFIEAAKNMHGDRYDYSLVDYKDYKTKVIIICSLHGQFKQTPQNHLRNMICSLCANNLPLGNEKFIEKAQKIHGNKYDYSLVEYKSRKNKIIIICKEHGQFKQRPEDHTNKKAGCPLCCKTNISQKEIKWLAYLNVPKKFKHKTLVINNKKYNFDAIDKKNKIIWEFYGDYWHGNPRFYQSDKIHPIKKISYGEMYNKTLKREEELKNLGYKIISIWEHEWDKIAKTLEQT